MISFLTPLSLLALGVIPLIRWLHRFRQQSRLFPSTTLFLWHNLQHEARSDGAPARPDPRWLLRALIVSLLLLSLAEPFVPSGQSRTLEVWLDDSLSMFAREAEQQRMQTGIRRLLEYLDESAPGRILVHSLGNPASSLLLEPLAVSRWPAQLAAWASQPRGEPLPPPPASLSPHSSHILLTDGADSNLNGWAASTPLVHVIQVGGATQNIALTRLSLRASLNESDHLSAIARIDNLGDSPQKISLTLQQGERLLETRPLDIPASGKTITSFTLAAGSRGSILARIEAANDALPLDDELQLDPQRLHPPLRVNLPAACDRYLLAVLEAHPAIVRDDNLADLIIDCSGQIQDTTQPILRLHPAGSVRRTRQTAHWHNDVSMDSLRMPPGLPYADQAPALSYAATPILSADDRLLILQRHGAGQIIDSYLDLSDPFFARRPEYPLLLLGLIGRLTGRALDNAPLTASRDREASRIRPTALPPMPAAAMQTQATSESFASLPLFGALLLLLLDVALASGRFHGFRRSGA